MPAMRSPRPWLNPDDHRYYLRIRVPKALKEAAGGKELHKVGLGTGDAGEAWARWPDALAKWEVLKERWRRQLGLSAGADNAIRLTQKECVALVGKWYRQELAEYEEDPGEPAAWDASADALIFALDDKRIPKSVDDDLDRLLATEELKVDLATRVRLLSLLARDKVRLYETLEQRARGNYAVDARLAEFPDWKKKRGQDGGSVTFSSLWESWKTNAGGALAPKTIEDTRRILDTLMVFLEHDDATRVSADDLMRWRSDLKEKGLTNNTWNNRLSLVGQVFLQAVKDRKITSNPAAGLRLRKNKKAVRLPFSDEQTVAILTAAREARRPSIRWSHWLMAFSGMRVGEAVQLFTTDIRDDDGLPYISINLDDPGKSVKTSLPRNVPIHPALIREGFLEFVASRRDPKNPNKGERLFPDKKPDKDGMYAGGAWNVTGRWVREVVGITDERYVPDHSWRHRMADELRGVEAPEEVRYGILGHARGGVGEDYGAKRGEALRRLARYLKKVKVPKGLSFA